MNIKQPTTHNQQIELMKSRGCNINDEVFCEDVLSKVNYYRLTAYFLPFRNNDGITYRPGTNFTQIYNIYEFDKQLRNIIISVIEDIEIYTRTKIAYYHAHKYGSLGYEDSLNYDKQHKHTVFKKIIAEEIKKNQNVLFVKHHLNNYDGKLPIWAIVELFSFGMLSRFYSDLPLSDRKNLAKELYGVDESIARSWLQCSTNLRNICAHYGRLYFRLLGAIPTTPKGHSFILDRQLFSALTMLKLMYPDKKKWNKFITSFQRLITKYSDFIQLQHMGMPDHWKKMLRK